MSNFHTKFFETNMQERPIEDVWNQFKQTLQKSIDKNIPSKTVSGRDKLPWITNHLRRLIRRRDRLHAKAKRPNSNRLYDLWRKVRRKATRALSTAHDNYVNNIVGDVRSNSKPFWNYIKTQRKDNQDMPPLKTTSGSDKAELLNTQFVDNFSKEKTDQVPYLKREYPTMPDIHVTAEGVHKLLNGLKTTKAAGPGDIHPRVLKEIALPISPVLACIFQKSLDTGVLPS